MLLAAQTIRAYCQQDHRPLIAPFAERAVSAGMTYGLSAAGYDCRIAQDVTLQPGEFVLASTIEHFVLPADLSMEVRDKSSWARRGLSAFNTVAEPGWIGWLTLELVNHGPDTIRIAAGSPIVQVQFKRLECQTDQPYRGRYQYQASGPQPAIIAKEGEE